MEQGGARPHFWNCGARKPYQDLTDGMAIRCAEVSGNRRAHLEEDPPVHTLGSLDDADGEESSGDDLGGGYRQTCTVQTFERASASLARNQQTDVSPF